MLTPIWQGMWLLNTSTAEQKFFADPNDVPGGYAILSHVWENETDTFQSVRDAVMEAKGETTVEKKVAEMQKTIAELQKEAAALKAKLRAKTRAKTKLLPGWASNMTRAKLRKSRGLCPLGEHQRVLFALH